MATLSDADKKVLLGSDHAREEAERDFERGTTHEERLAKSRRDFATNVIGTAAGVGIVAFLIGLANYTSHGTPYNPTLVASCVIVVIASAAVVAWFMRSQRQGV